MGVSTKKGDTGHTSLLRGERVPKYHLRIEAGGALDEANAQLGLARASVKEKRIKRILLQTQKHLFIIGAELSAPKGTGKALTRTISDTDVKWLDGLVEEYEEALALPPGFVAFGQEEESSHLDVARASIRKVERMVVKMKDEGLIENSHLLKYLNRLSDLIFLMACFEEKDEEEKRKIKETHFPSHLLNPKWIWTGMAFITISMILFASWQIFRERDSSNIPRKEPIITSQNSVHLKPSDLADFKSLPAASLPSTLESRDGVNLRLVLGGTFTLPKSFGLESGRLIKVAPFYMDETQVTNHQYVEFLNRLIAKISVDKNIVKGNDEIWLILGEAFEGYEPIVFRDGRFFVNKPAHASCPVIRVTAHGASAYADFYGRRLPTDAEWLLLTKEAAEPSRAPKGASRSTGQMEMDEMMGRMRSHTRINPLPEPPHVPSPVMTYSPNAYGIRGLNANISEWGLSIIRTPFNVTSKEQDVEYVILGGLGTNSRNRVDIPSPLSRQPWEAFEKVGFRCVLNIPQRDEG